MHIDKFLKEDGFSEYIDETGCTWNSIEDFIQDSILNFCCCGRPKDNLLLFRDGLNHINRRMVEDIDHKLWREQGLSIFGNEKSEYLFYYICDEKDLTEHGGSVPGWLTEKGEHLLEDLNEMFPPEDEG